MKVIGMKKELFMQQTCEGHNCDFTYGEREAERHRLYLEDSGQLYELLLYTEEDECGSGWCVAEYGMIKLKEISELPSGTLKSTVNKEFDMVNKDMESYSCDLFSFDIYGGDRYYPMGRYEVNESLFIKSEE